MSGPTRPGLTRTSTARTATNARACPVWTYGSEGGAILEPDPAPRLVRRWTWAARRPSRDACEGRPQLASDGYGSERRELESLRVRQQAPSLDLQPRGLRTLRTRIRTPEAQAPRRARPTPRAANVLAPLPAAPLLTGGRTVGVRSPSRPSRMASTRSHRVTGDLGRGRRRSDLYLAGPNLRPTASGSAPQQVPLDHLQLLGSADVPGG
jgi:hypothetical protein